MFVQTHSLQRARHHNLASNAILNGRSQSIQNRPAQNHHNQQQTHSKAFSCNTSPRKRSQECRSLNSSSLKLDTHYSSNQLFFHNNCAHKIDQTLNEVPEGDRKWCKRQHKEPEAKVGCHCVAKQSLSLPAELILIDKRHKWQSKPTSDKINETKAIYERRSRIISRIETEPRANEENDLHDHHQQQQQHELKHSISDSTALVKKSESKQKLQKASLLTLVKSLFGISIQINRLLGWKASGEAKGGKKAKAEPKTSRQLAARSNLHLELISAFLLNFVSYQLETWLQLVDCTTSRSPSSTSYSSAMSYSYSFLAPEPGAAAAEMVSSSIYEQQQTGQQLASRQFSPHLHRHNHPSLSSGLSLSSRANSADPNLYGAIGDSDYQNAAFNQPVNHFYTVASCIPDSMPLTADHNCWQAQLTPAPTQQKPYGGLHVSMIGGQVHPLEASVMSCSLPTEVKFRQQIPDSLDSSCADEATVSWPLPARNCNQPAASTAKANTNLTYWPEARCRLVRQQPGMEQVITGSDSDIYTRYRLSGAQVRCVLATEQKPYHIHTACCKHQTNVSAQQRHRPQQQEQNSSAEASSDLAETGRGSSLSNCTAKTSASVRQKRGTSKLSLAGARRRLGFKQKGLSSLNIQRSEEIFPAEQLKLATATNSFSDSGNESSAHIRSQPPSNGQDPRVCFVEGLGVGQIVSRQGLVSPYLGDIQLSLSDRRGMLEVEIIRARRLQAKVGALRLPFPYVKVYLMKNKKCIAKFKTTASINRTLDPLYQQQFIFREDYSNCILQVIVWGDYDKRDRKSLMGIVQIHLNDLDISSLVISWYKLFNAPSMANSLQSSKELRRKLLSSSKSSDGVVARK